MVDGPKFRQTNNLDWRNLTVTGALLIFYTNVDCKRTLSAWTWLSYRFSAITKIRPNLKPK